MKKMMLVLVSLLVAGSLFADSASFKKVWDDVVKAQKVTITKSTPIQTYNEVVDADIKAKIKAADALKKYGKTVSDVLNDAVLGKKKPADVVAAFAKAKDVPPTLAAGSKAGIKVVGKDNKLDQKGIDALMAALKAKKLTAAYDAKTDTLTVTE